VLDPAVVSDVLDELGGLLGLEAALTDDERRKVLAASNFEARYDPTTREALFKVDLACGVSVGVGGPTRNFAARALVVESPWSELCHAA
jgi:hypothetical protein